MLKRMKLGTKLLVAFLMVGLIPLTVVALVSLYQSSEALKHSSYNQLVSMREVKKAQVEGYLKDREADMGVLMDLVGVLQNSAFQKLAAIQEIKKAQVEGFFVDAQKDVAVLGRTNSVQEALADFTRAVDTDQKVGGDAWGIADERYGPYLQAFCKEHGFYDLFLINTKGQVVYSVTRESDFGQNLKTGPLASSGLGQVFAQGLKEYAIADFAPYEPSGGKQAAFVAAPIGKPPAVIGVVALQLPTEPLQEIVGHRAGMGQTGETYLVGQHQGKSAFRSAMTTMGGGKFVVGHPISTEYIAKALAGERGEEVFTDSAGKLVMVDFEPLKIQGLNWAMVSKMDMEEAIAPDIKGEEGDLFHHYIKEYGYYDLFLIHPKGQIFYTVTHEADYQTNIIDGKYASSGLGEAVRKAIKDKKYAIADFAPYAPSNDDPAAFIAQPVLHQGQVELVVALQLSLEKMNQLMQQRAGMGQTGETYLVGSDHLMRSDSFLDPKHHSVKASFADPAKGGVKTRAAQAALAGQTGREIITDYNGNQVLSAFTPVKVGDTTWALLAEIDEAEAFAAIDQLEWEMLIMAVAGLLGIALIAVFIGRSISKPINVVVDGLGQGGQQVAAAAEQVSSASQSLAQGSSEQAASLEETSSSLEEMASMTRQNAENAGQADSLVKETSAVVERANRSMKDLKEAMSRITAASDETAKIIKTIDEIAFQTNLLALNAAVEAARAGEAGAGFAVVADEVRNLAIRAAEAAKSTSDLIEGNISNIKEGADLVSQADEAFDQVAESNGKVSELVGEIAAASQEQAQGIDQVNRATGEMDKVTQQVAANAEESAAASEELASQAESMQGMVNDLAALVHGVGAGGNSSSHLLPPPTRQPRLGKAQPSRPQPEPARLGETPPPRRSATGSTPEEVIPFDDDGQEGDFRDF